MSIQIRKPAGTWNGLTMVVDGQISKSGTVTPSSISTVIHLNYEDVESVFDQFLKLGNAKLDSVVIDIAGKLYTFNSEMATDLLGVVSVTCNTHEGIYADTEYLPMEEWTEEYLLSL